MYVFFSSKLKVTRTEIHRKEHTYIQINNHAVERKKSLTLLFAVLNYKTKKISFICFDINKLVADIFLFVGGDDKHTHTYTRIYKV